MPEAVLINQFPQTPPIFINERLVDDFFDQRVERETKIRRAVLLLVGAPVKVRADILNAAFEQRFDQCVPFFGKPCAYRKICHGHVENPLEEGFTWRVPHHALELEQLGG